MDAYQRDVDNHQLYKAKQDAPNPEGHPGNPDNGNEESQQVCPRCKKLHNSTSFVTCLSGRSICFKCAETLQTCFFHYELTDVGVMIKLNMDCEHYSCAGCFKEAWNSALNDRYLPYPPE